MSDPLRLDEGNLPEYLRKVSLLGPGEAARIEPVGDGNINWVRRVQCPGAVFVVKQARQALERFPQYRVSTERLVIEARFYEAARPLDPDRVCPKVIHVDAENFVLVLEDLSEAERLDTALARGADVSAPAATLVRFLARLHAGTRDAFPGERFANAEMQRLHGEHIFHLPYRPNDFPLSTAVAERADEIRADAELVARIDAAYASYLAPGPCLVHGDVQPANVLLSAEGPKLLDAEIAHMGDPAFDVGQLLGHLLLPAAARGQPHAASAVLGTVWQAYTAEAGTTACALADAARYAGIELLRRTLGAARVPAVASDAASLAVVDAGLGLLRDGLEL